MLGNGQLGGELPRALLRALDLGGELHSPDAGLPGLHGEREDPRRVRVDPIVERARVGFRRVDPILQRGAGRTRKAEARGREDRHRHGRPGEHAPTPGIGPPQEASGPAVWCSCRGHLLRMPAGLADGLTRKGVALRRSSAGDSPLAAIGVAYGFPASSDRGIRLYRAWNRSGRSHTPAAGVAAATTLGAPARNRADRARCLGGEAQLTLAAVGAADLAEDAE